MLETDTLYYRWDHPNGFLFSAGAETPDPDDGWVLDQGSVGSGPVVNYECSTLAAFQALLNSERAASRATITNIGRELDVATGLAADLARMVQNLEQELADALNPASGG